MNKKKMQRLGKSCIVNNLKDNYNNNESEKDLCVANIFLAEVSASLKIKSFAQELLSQKELSRNQKQDLEPVIAWSLRSPALAGNKALSNLRIELIEFIIELIVKQRLTALSRKYFESLESNLKIYQTI
jgi:hypothetical protein